MTELPQRVLAVKLRTAIDRAMRHPSSRWRFQVWWLMEQNPRGSRSSHVLHNLGAARRAWLAQLDTTAGTRSLEQDVPTTFSSLSDEEQEEWRRYLRKRVAQLYGVSEESLMVRKHEIPATEKPAGGPIKPQGEYMVGEKGEETFIPTTPGTIVKEQAIRGDAVPEKKG